MNNDKDNKNNKNNNDKGIPKFPRSSKGQQCIGPCYPSNVYARHPQTLSHITADTNFCPVTPFITKDPYTGKNTVADYDKCNVPTNQDEYVDDLYINLVFPSFHFTSEYFLKEYYKIYNLEDLLIWFDTHLMDPFFSRKRIFEAGMIAYGDEIQVIDHRLVTIVNEIIEDLMFEVYFEIKQYLTVKNNVIMLTKESLLKDQGKGMHSYAAFNDPDIVDSFLFYSGYIREKFGGIDNIHQFLSKFIRYYKEELLNIDVINNILNRFIEYIVKRINLTLEASSNSLPSGSDTDSGENKY